MSGMPAVPGWCNCRPVGSSAAARWATWLPVRRRSSACTCSLVGPGLCRGRNAGSCGRDFWLPTDRADAEDALREAWRQCTAQRVEIACRGSRGRTGTALACLAVLDGVTAREAVSYVRDGYDPRAVETPPW